VGHGLLLSKGADGTLAQSAPDTYHRDMPDKPNQRWNPGDVVVFRYVETPTSTRMVHAYMGDPAGTSSGGQPFLVGGEVVTVQARPYRVIEDTDDVLALYQPGGTTLPRWQMSEQRYLPDVPPTRAETVRLLFPGKGYDVTLFFETDSEPPWFYDALFDGNGLRDGWRDRRRDAGLGMDPAPRKGRAGVFRGWYVNLQSPFRRTSYGVDVVDQVLDIVVRPDRSWYWKDEDELALAVATGACDQEHADVIRRAGQELPALIEAGEPPFDDSWRNWRPPEGWSIAGVPDGWQFAPALLDQWW
jgi:hypothetical protein